MRRGGGVRCALKAESLVQEMTFGLNKRDEREELKLSMAPRVFLDHLDREVENGTIYW